MLRTPKQDESVVIYETRKNRVSGSHTQVVDERPNGAKYALRCVTHDFTTPRNVRLAAEAESHKSHDWCPSCTDTRDADKIKADVGRVSVNLGSSREEIDAFMVVWEKEQVVNNLPDADTIRDLIKNATSKKTCMERVASL